MRRPSPRARSIAAGGLLRHLVRLGVQGVVGEVVGAHRAEGVEPDGERHLEYLVPAAHLGPHLGGEVEPRGGCRRGPRRPRIHGLVVIRALERAVDVRRHGHLADPLEHGGVRYGTIERDGDVTLLQHVGDEDRGAGRIERLAGAQATGGARQGVPRPVRALLEEQQLDRATGCAAGVDPRGQDARVVHHDQVVVAELVGQVREHPVAHLTGRAVVDHEARARARLGRRLRDQVAGKVVVELSGAHRREYRRASSARTRPGSMWYVEPATRRVRGAGEVPHAPALDRPQVDVAAAPRPVHVEVDLGRARCRRRSRSPSPRP